MGLPFLSAFFTLDSSLWLIPGALALCLIVYIAIVYRKRSLPLVALLSSFCFLSLLSANVNLTTSTHKKINLFLIDTSGSFRPFLEQHWPSLRAQLRELHASQVSPLPSRVFFFDRVIHTETYAEADQILELPETLPPSSNPSASYPWLFKDFVSKRYSHDAQKLEELPARMILLSDGAFDHKRFQRSLGQTPVMLLNSGAVIDPLRLEHFELPSELEVGTSPQAQLTIVTSKSLQARIQLLHSRKGEKFEQAFRTTQAGPSTLSLNLPKTWFQTEGLLEIEAKLLTDQQDQLPENNQRTQIVKVGKEKPLLYLSGKELNPEHDPLRQLLIKANLAFETKHPHQLKNDPFLLTSYSGILLNDLPLKDLPEEGEILYQAVSELGLGLIVAGAEYAWGPGGYAASPLERVTPLDSEPDLEQEKYQIILLDISASMGQPHRDTTRFILLQKALEKILQKSSKQDHVALVPFNASPLWETNFHTWEDQETRRELFQQLKLLQPQGKTFITPAFFQAFDSFEQKISTPKQAQEAIKEEILLISDAQGKIAPEDIKRLVKLTQKRGTTIKVLLLGEQQPEWLSSYSQQLEAASAGATPDQFSILQIPDFDLLLPRLEAELKEEKMALLHDQPLVAHLKPEPQTLPEEPQAQEPFEIQRWVESALKTHSGAEALLEAIEPPFFPLIARWKYLQGRCCGISFACDNQASSLAQDSRLQEVVYNQIIWATAQAPAPPFQLEILEASPNKISNGDFFIQLSSHNFDDDKAVLADFEAKLLHYPQGFEETLFFTQSGPFSWQAPLPENFKAGSATLILENKNREHGNPQPQILHLSLPPQAEFFPEPQSFQKLQRFFLSEPQNTTVYEGLLQKGQKLPQIQLSNHISAQKSAPDKIFSLTLLWLSLFIITLFSGLWLRSRPLTKRIKQT